MPLTRIKQSGLTANTFVIAAGNATKVTSNVTATSTTVTIESTIPHPFLISLL